jgi:hypothetical protein
MQNIILIGWLEGPTDMSVPRKHLTLYKTLPNHRQPVVDLLLIRHVGVSAHVSSVVRRLARLNLEVTTIGSPSFILTQKEYTIQVSCSQQKPTRPVSSDSKCAISSDPRTCPVIWSLIRISEKVFNGRITKQEISA